MIAQQLKWAAWGICGLGIDCQLYIYREREREGSTHPIDLISFSYLLYCVLLTKTEYYLLYKLRSIKHKLIESYRLSLNVNKLY